MIRPWCDMKTFPRDGHEVEVQCDDGHIRRACWYIDKVVFTRSTHAAFTATFWRELRQQ